MKNQKSVSAKKEIAVVAPIIIPSAENVEMLQKLNAIGITESLKEKNSGKSIFKTEFNNKKDRTQCRTKFINAVGLYLLFTAKGNKDLADKNLIIASEIAEKYYIAETEFKNVSDYASANMEENKREQIKMFIDLLSPAK